MKHVSSFLWWVGLIVVVMWIIKNPSIIISTVEFLSGLLRSFFSFVQGVTE